MESGSIGRIVSTLIGFTSVAVVHAQPVTPDVVLLNGKVLTVDAQFSIAQAIAVRGERILAVGPTAEIAQMTGPETHVIELGGKTVIPGLIDNHVHFLDRLSGGRTRFVSTALPRVRRPLQALQRGQSSPGPASGC